MSEFFKEGAIEHMCCDAMTEAIQAHGPITQAMKASAAKRIAARLRGELRGIAKQEVQDEAIQKELERLDKELNKARAKTKTLQKVVNDLTAKCKKAGLI